MSEPDVTDALVQAARMAADSEILDAAPTTLAACVEVAVATTVTYLLQTGLVSPLPYEDWPITLPMRLDQVEDWKKHP